MSHNPQAVHLCAVAAASVNIAVRLAAAASTAVREALFADPLLALRVAARPAWFVARAASAVADLHEA